MKNILIGAMLTTGVLALPALAQDKLPREEALKYALVACGNLKEMLNTPIPTDPDVKRPVVLRDGDYGGMLLPEAKLSAETFAKLGKEVAAIGQLWMNKLTFLKGDEAILEGKMRKIQVSTGEAEVSVTCTALGARKAADGGLELVIYGKGAEPLLAVPLKSVSGAGTDVADMSAERTDRGATITLTFAGKYRAILTVTDPDQY